MTIEFFRGGGGGGGHGGGGGGRGFGGGSPGRGFGGSPGRGFGPGRGWGPGRGYRPGRGYYGPGRGSYYGGCPYGRCPYLYGGYSAPYYMDDVEYVQVNDNDDNAMLCFQTDEGLVCYDNSVDVNTLPAP